MNVDFDKVPSPFVNIEIDELFKDPKGGLIDFKLADLEEKLVNLVKSNEFEVTQEMNIIV